MGITVMTYKEKIVKSELEFKYNLDRGTVIGILGQSILLYLLL